MVMVMSMHVIACICIRNHRATTLTDRRIGKKFPIRLSVTSPCFTADTAGIRYHRATTLTDRRIGKKSSYSSVRRKSMLHRHRRHPLPLCNQRASCNNVDGQTNWIKIILFVCPSLVHASQPTPPASATILQQH